MRTLRRSSISASPHPTPSRPPSRQSTRIITPVRTDPNFIRPHADSRKSIAQVRRDQSDSEGLNSPSKSTVPCTSKSTRQVSNKRRRSEVDGSQTNSEQNHILMDLTQDSDQENSKVKKPRKTRVRKDSEFGLDAIELYFHKPVYANGDKPPTPKRAAEGRKKPMIEPMYYECRWCGVTYKKGEGTRGNLVKHCDGSSNWAPCSNRADAILAGAKLPLTAKEIAEKGSSAVQLGPFDGRVFNQLLVMWLVRHSLPWNRIEDIDLEVVFRYARPGIKINSRGWAASEAHRLYCNLQDKVISTLNELPSKICLINDIWTTKGNRQAFMGISVAYVTADWEYKVIHLGLKYIAWTHKGKFLAVPFANIITKSMLHQKISFSLSKQDFSKTTDSGSNNGTMASEVDRLVRQKTGTELNLADNHIRCFCHKVALILNAGLKAIDIGDDGLAEPKKATLGFVPELLPVTKEPDNIDVLDQFKEEVVIPLDDGGESDSEVSDDKANTSTQSTRNRIAVILKKVDTVIQKITGSAAKRSEYDFWAPKIEDVPPPTLIAGYGIRWNIKFQSRERGYKGRNVIHKLMEIERDPQDSEWGKNFYDNIEITRSDWEVVKRLNDVIGEFFFITKKMEGDISSAGMMLAEYRWIKTYLGQRLASPTDTELASMHRKMIEEQIATILNPTYCLTMIQMWFPSHYSFAETLIKTQFAQRKLEHEEHTSPKRPPPTLDGNRKLRHRDHDAVVFFPSMVDTTTQDELAVYLSGKYNLPIDKSGDALLWWKEHTGKFPILSLLARDYLACCATSASVERCFSAAADTCGRDRGSLASRTIERCVSSHQWLLQGVQADATFEEAHRIVARMGTIIERKRTIHVPTPSTSS
ncbi:hypothetical protein PSTG_16934 [Puccinia striiformis f. sp. tritici PST-78]|uniref:HAT C-terminal dimerisation domain-containing protein n=1 Tax=Puccinia striiformis f. sp. tritici PST-78 TaxID=1165861 RepID=A0A0L0URT9_9BASI|nr:hypothetical protein PSTG_16934 [Puccinia striiformis f. sp. tritici PST-78]